MDQPDNSKQKFRIRVFFLILVAVLFIVWILYNAIIVHNDLFWLFTMERYSGFLAMGFFLIVTIPILYFYRSNKNSDVETPLHDTGEDVEGSLQEPGSEIPMETDYTEGRIPYYAMAVTLVFFSTGMIYGNSRALDLTLMFIGSIMVVAGLTFLLVRDWGTRWAINLFTIVLFTVIFGIVAVAVY